MRFNSFLAATILITAALGQLNRLFLGDGEGAVLYINDLLVGILAVLYISHALIVRKSWKIPPVFLGIWLFLLFGGLGLLLSWSVLSRMEFMISLSYLLRYICYSFLFFVAYDAVVYTAKAEDAELRLWNWIKVILVASVLVAMSGFIQLYLLPDLGGLAKYGWDPHLNRLTTAMLDPNYAGAYLSIGAAMAISLFLYIKNTRQQAVLLAIIAVLLLAILLTYSRSGYLMLAICLSIIALFRSRWLLVVGTVMAIMAIVLVPRVQQRIAGAFEVDASASPRIVSWQNSLFIAMHNQPLGVGYNTYRYAQDRYGILNLEESGNAGAGADSSWLFILATTGILGLLAFAASYLGIIAAAIKGLLMGRTPIAQALSLAGLAVLVGLAVFSMFNNALFYTWIMELIWVMCGLIVAISQVLLRPLESER